jgi:hypothetical protein
MNIIGKSVWDIKEYKGNKVFVAEYTTPEHCLLVSEQGDELVVKIRKDYKGNGVFDDIIESICDDSFVKEAL